MSAAELKQLIESIAISQRIGIAAIIQSGEFEIQDVQPSF